MANTTRGKSITWAKKISEAKKGHGWPTGYKERQSKAQKERFKKENIWNKGISFGNASWYWKDRSNEYRALHKRIARKYGKLSLCEECGRIDRKLYVWANISGEYKEIRSDWKRLCQGCHMKMDKIHITKNELMEILK